MSNIKKIKRDNILQESYSLSTTNYDKKKYQLSIVDENGSFDLRTSEGDTIFFTHSKKLSELVYSEIWKNEEVQFVNHSISDEILYYWLESKYISLKLDDLSERLPLTINEAPDLFCLLPSNYIKSLTGNDFSKIVKYFNDEGIEMLQAIIDEPKKKAGDNKSNIEDTTIVFNDINNPALNIVNEKEVEKSINRELILNIYDDLPIYQKSAVLILNHYVDSLLIGILFTKGLLNQDQICDIQNKITDILEYYKYPQANLRPGCEKLYNVLDKISKYLLLKEKEEITKIILKGESKNIEFKSTLRYDLKQKTILKDREKDVLKTIVGFLNTEGGKLFIGIEDNGHILGIEHDKFKNTDKFLLHLHNLIQNKIKPKPNRSINTKIETISGKNICIVYCMTANEPTFLNSEKNKEEFFIRTGPSTRKLNPSELANYVREKFKKKEP